MQQRVAGRHVICSPVPYVAGRYTFWSLLLLFIISGGGDGDYVDLGDDIEKSPSNITLWLWSFMPLFIEIFMTIQHL